MYQLPQLIVQRHQYEIMRDNFWKMSFSITYDFSIGKNYEGYRSLENEDTDRAIL